MQQQQQHQLQKNLKFKDYVPQVFVTIRKLLLTGVTAAAINLDAQNQQQDDHSKTSQHDAIQHQFAKVVTQCEFNFSRSSGKSGAYLAITPTYVLKTISKSEGKYLTRKVLPKLLEYQQQQQQKNASGGTLLNHIYGLYKFKVEGKTCRFVIMNNVISITNSSSNKYDLKYLLDLKGSKVGRSATDEEQKKNQLKDNDVLERGMKFNIGNHSKTQLMTMLRSDTALLESIQSMDYSLMVAVYEMQSQQQDNSNSNTATTTTNAIQSSHMYASQDNPKIVYVVGLIDYLQKWNAKKIAAMAIKSFNNVTNELSTVPPKLYAKRLVEFIDALFC